MVKPLVLEGKLWLECTGIFSARSLTFSDVTPEDFEAGRVYILCRPVNIANSVLEHFGDSPMTNLGDKYIGMVRITIERIERE